MSKVPLIHDAASYLMLNKWRGSVLAGDGPNCFDHTFLPQYTDKSKGISDAGEKDKTRKTCALKMTVSGVVVCMHDDEEDKTNLTCKDQKGRDSYKRAKPQYMADFLRCPYKPKQYGKNECEQHWNDLTTAYEALPTPRPTVFVVCSDNGNSYSPHHMMNLYYADLLMKKYPDIELVILSSFAAGQSAKNHEIERMWAQHKKQFPGARFGAFILNFELRAPKDEEECIQVVKCAASEMKEVIERNVNVCEVKDEIIAPEVKYVEPPTKGELETNEFIHEFFMSNKKVIAEDPRFETLRKTLKDINRRSNSTMCQACLWKTDDHAIRQKYFGLSEKPPEPEVCIELTKRLREIHYTTFTQLLEKYYATNTEQKEDRTRCPGHETDAWKQSDSFCCGKLFLNESTRKRHYLHCHPNASQPGRHTFTLPMRRAPTKCVVKQVRVGTKNGKLINFDFKDDKEEH